LSLTPSAVGPVKAMLLELDCRKTAAFLCPLIDQIEPRRADPQQ
jgi:signal transduction protein with GAF and PtsI domain